MKLAELTEPFKRSLDEAGKSTKNVSVFAGREDLATTIGGTIQVILAVLGILLLITIVYAGILYTMGFGESTERIDKAKSMIKYSVVGLAVVLVAYSFTAFVLSRIALIK